MERATILRPPRHQFRDPVLAKMAAVSLDLGDPQMVLTYMTTTVATAVLQAITTTGLYLGIHASSPGNTGANEIVGSGMVGYSSGGYTGVSDGTSTGRPKITWGAFATDHQTSSVTATFALLAAQASGINYFSLWTDTGATSHAGTFLFGGPTSGTVNGSSIPNGANVTFASSVTLTVTA